jgi:hypothetical protein
VRKVRPIYVESRIRCSLDELWAATQDPRLHQRWDLRFSQITYAAREPDQPQRFSYRTTVAPGVSVAGTGETIGDRDRPDGSRWSGLKFWAADRKSLIESGAGYWRYLPGPHADGQPGIRFLTRFDYRTRWGRTGDLADRLLFRPLFGWATAWSFDRLRLWLEEGITPERSRNQAIAHAAAVIGVTTVWLYQGAVPKLLRADDDEVRIWRVLGLGDGGARAAVRAVGLAEIGIAGLLAATRRSTWPYLATAAAMPLLTVAAAVADRSLLARAFNPVTLNVATAALAVVAATTAGDLPSGLRPLRAAPDSREETGNV